MYQTRTATQTATQAKRLASRIGAELLQVRAFYGAPSLDTIEKFAVEAEMYLAAGYLEKVEYGFKRGGSVVFELEYTAAQASGIDDKPGRVPPDCNVSGATWFSHLTQNAVWWGLTQAERDAFERRLPVERTGALAPVGASGLYATNRKIFSEDTLGLNRVVRRL